MNTRIRITFGSISIEKHSDYNLHPVDLSRIRSRFFLEPPCLERCLETSFPRPRRRGGCHQGRGRQPRSPWPPRPPRTHGAPGPQRTEGAARHSRETWPRRETRGCGEHSIERTRIVGNGGYFVCSVTNDKNDKEARENFEPADLLSYGNRRWRRVQYLVQEF